MFVVPLTSPWWSQGLRSEIPGNPEDEGDPGGGAAGTRPTPDERDGDDSSTLKMVLHTRMPDKPGLVVVEREIPYVKGAAAQIRAAVSELAVSSEGAPALLPEGTRVLVVAFSKPGTTYVDFSTELEAGRGVGTEEERLLVMGIVRTIVDNFAAVRRVVILVDGRAPGPGHLDLSKPLRRDDPIFAEDPEAEPETSPGTGARRPTDPATLPIIPQTPAVSPSPVASPSKNQRPSPASTPAPKLQPDPQAPQKDASANPL